MIFHTVHTLHEAIAILQIILISSIPDIYDVLHISINFKQYEKPQKEVPVNSEVRIQTKCVDVTEKNPGQFLVKNEVSMEIKGVDKPAYIAETLSLFIT